MHQTNEFVSQTIKWHVQPGVSRQKSIYANEFAFVKKTVTYHDIVLLRTTPWQSELLVFHNEYPGIDLTGTCRGSQEPSHFARAPYVERERVPRWRNSNGSDDVREEDRTLGRHAWPARMRDLPRTGTSSSSHESMASMHGEFCVSLSQADLTAGAFVLFRESTSRDTLGTLWSSPAKVESDLV